MEKQYTLAQQRRVGGDEAVEGEERLAGVDGVEEEAGGAGDIDEEAQLLWRGDAVAGALPAILSSKESDAGGGREGTSSRASWSMRAAILSK